MKVRERLDGKPPQGRIAFDAYMTPPHYVAALLGEVNIYGRVYEPCVGDGAISNILRKLPTVSSVLTNDIDRKREADTHFDATTARAWQFGGRTPDWSVSNLPFSDEIEIIEQAFDSEIKNHVYLARLSFLEPCEDREYFLEQNPPQQIIVLPRYSFRPNDEGKKATDSVTCMWMVWLADRQPRRISAWGRAKAQAYAIMRDL